MSDLFRKNKYGSLAPVPTVRPGALCTDRAQEEGAQDQRFPQVGVAAGVGHASPAGFLPWAPHGAGSSSAS